MTDVLSQICSRCAKFRKQCKYDRGLKDDLTFRNLTTSRTSKYPTTKIRRAVFTSPTSASDISSRDGNSGSCALSDADEQAVMHKFIADFCLRTKDPAISRGYLDGLPDIVFQAGPKSELARAVLTVAYGRLGVLNNQKDYLRLAERSYGDLLANFQLKIMTMNRDTSLVNFLIANMLGLYEIITATTEAPSRHGTHLTGIAAILSSSESPFDLPKGLAAFSMVNTLPMKIPVDVSGND